MPETHHTLFADYHQIFIQDIAIKDGAEDVDWPASAFEQRVLVHEFDEGGHITITTARNMDVPVRVSVSDTEPALDLTCWDHVVECTIRVPSGKLMIAGLMDYTPEADRITLPNNSGSHWHVRVLMAGLDDLSDDGLEGNDHYRIEIWPSSSVLSQNPVILKNHPLS